MLIRYLFVYLLLAKSFAVYCLDIFTAITMLSTDNWTNAIYRKCGDDCVVTIKFEVAKWIFVGCIIASFVLVSIESLSTCLYYSQLTLNLCFYLRSSLMRVTKPG